MSRRADRATARTAVLLAGLALTGALAGCAEESVTGDSFTDRQGEEPPLPEEDS